MSLGSWIDDIEKRDWQRTNTGNLRLALIGVGWWTVDVAIPAIAETELCESTVLVSSDEAKASEVGDEHDIDHAITYEAFHDGTCIDEYDAVYIATPNAYHLEYAETAADLGAAVLCEKPMEASVDRAERMVHACADVPLMIAYRMQTDPLVRRTKELLDDGIIGDVRYISGTNQQPLLEMNGDPDQWRLDSDLTGYGTSVMDIGIYVLNTARFVLDRDPIEAFARMESVDDAFADVPDQWASFSLLLEGDIPLVGTTSQDAQSASSLVISGDAGRLTLAPAYSGEVVLTVERGDATVEVTTDAIDAQREMREEFDYFADRVLAGDDITPDGEHGLTDMATIAAIHHAAESGTPVSL